MIVVNTPGYGAHPFAPLLHAEWNGFTLTDLVFPTFLFVVGNALSFTVPAYLNKGRNFYFRKTVKRTVIIFFLGFLMYCFPFFIKDSGGWHLRSLSEARIMGVLQRIALCYFIASVIVAFLSDRLILIISLFLLGGYWASLYIWGNRIAPLSVHGNAVYLLDAFLFGDSHLYHGSAGVFDPEGILSTFPAVVNVIAGYCAGKFLRRKQVTYETISKLLIIGNVLVFVAICWNPFFPFNKKLWTSSFVCLTVGLDLLILSFLIYITDVAGYKQWSRFFIPFGKNPLFIYLLSELLWAVFWFIPFGQNSNLYKEVCTALFFYIPGAWGSLLFAVSYMLLCWVVAWWLNRQKICIKV